SPPSARHSAVARDSASRRAVYIVFTSCENGAHAEEETSVPPVNDHAPEQLQPPVYPMWKTAVPSTCPTGSKATPRTAAHSSAESADPQVLLLEISAIRAWAASGRSASRCCVMGSCATASRLALNDCDVTRQRMTSAVRVKRHRGPLAERAAYAAVAG